MESGKIARLGLVKQRVRDASRARLVAARAALVVVEERIDAASAATVRAAAALGSPEMIASDLELRASAVVECTAHERALATERTAREAEVETSRLVRIDAERDVAMLDHARERALASERAEASKREDAELDDRAAVQRRTA